MIRKLTPSKSKASSASVWRDFDEISESFDLALSPEVIGWFREQNSNVQARKRAVNRCELDEYELSLR
ncbi:hypothetical protein [Candidatus Methylomicrobium oryzae]|jgi:hypothetical protein|uniref:hypothetical protein n=1 Tax=Candidatus Methylomicrobium oryzae TaxID=2802053 RepID=UPI001922CE33|nr:hypothetical protein [Methylomicrobium sp. RS1]MBL1262561.1 hypothetical protein [Methylomicrobium sp. RS1]